MPKPAERQVLTCGRSPDHHARWFVADAGRPPTIWPNRSQDRVTGPSSSRRKSPNSRQLADTLPVSQRRPSRGDRKIKPIVTAPDIATGARRNCASH